MIATQNQQAPKDTLSFSLPTDNLSNPNLDTVSAHHLQQMEKSALLPSKVVVHHPKAGLNPLVDNAAYLFSVLAKLKYIKSFRLLGKLQKELIQEINSFQETAKKHGYNPEYLVVCRYILCATFDDIIANTTWGGHGQWDTYGLLAALNQDTHHQDKFFIILERALKEPALYIDLMELIYLCLSMGYKGQYRRTEHNQYQLEQITNNLYKHIRAYRGSFTRTLSPSLKSAKSAGKTVIERRLSLLSILFFTACINITIFISLGYLMDVISNEAYKNVTQVQSTKTTNF